MRYRLYIFVLFVLLGAALTLVYLIVAPFLGLLTVAKVLGACVVYTPRSRKTRKVFSIDDNGNLCVKDAPRSKFGNVKTEGMDKDGNLIMFDSGAEAMRNRDLVLMEKAGMVRDLRRQVRYELVPKQKGERAVVYVADFVYVDVTSGLEITEDVKGKLTKDYIIKRKLMREKHGITILETTMRKGRGRVRR
jgi:hypothetical protein